MPLALGMLAFDDLGMILRLHEIFLAKSSWYVSASLQCKQTNLYSKKKKKNHSVLPCHPLPGPFLRGNGLFPFSIYFFHLKKKKQISDFEKEQCVFYTHFLSPKPIFPPNISLPLSLHLLSSNPL
jgi:hypothetical protein